MLPRAIHANGGRPLILIGQKRQRSLPTLNLRLSSPERAGSECITSAVRASFMITFFNQSPARSLHRAFNNAATSSHPSQRWPTVVPDWWKRQRGLPTLALRLSSPERVGSECTASAVRSPFMITRPNQSPASLHDYAPQPIAGTLTASSLQQRCREPFMPTVADR